MYDKILKELLIKICFKYCSEGNVDIIEWRYMFGDISDEDGNIFSFDKDIELIMEVINEVKSKFP